MIITTKLYRPVGLKEMELILNADAKAFPPRLEWQPIFYPVMNFEYAAEIATQWNTIDEASGFCGIVTVFNLSTAYLQEFEVQNVGYTHHNELWVPADQLAEFNSHIVGIIRIDAIYYGANYTGILESSAVFKHKTAKEQTAILNGLDSAGLLEVLTQERSALIINFQYWLTNGLNRSTGERIRQLMGNEINNSTSFGEIIPH